ncbi:hypothetical protein [Streptacidiphilus sp. EB103A]|uniref:hypothetical protein n=1 Tax=Streptacidiphilus sp. EB103A TaxID=3156275 RepID=UPI0035168BE2
MLPLDSWRREAQWVVGDVDRMLADTAPGLPRTIAVPPTATEVLARMRLPRRAAVRRTGGWSAARSRRRADTRSAAHCTASATCCSRLRTVFQSVSPLEGHA